MNINRASFFSRKLLPISAITALIVSSLLFTTSAQANPNKPDNTGKANPSANSNAGGNSNAKPNNRPENTDSTSNETSSNSNENGNSKSKSQNNETPQSNTRNTETNRVITVGSKIKENNAASKGAAVSGNSGKTKNVVDERKFKVASLLKGQASKKRVNKRADRVKFPKSDPQCGEAIVRGNAKNPIITGEKVECFDYLVVFTAGTSQAQANSAVGSINGQVKRNYNRVINAALINANPNRINALANNPRVRLIEQDAIVTTAGIQSNPSWGLDRIDQRALPLSGTYDDANNTGSNIPVYIVDTGIYAAHVDFENRVTSGFTVITDGRGSNDCNGHGTHVAGTVGGKNFGVAKTVTLIPVRVLDCNGSGTLSGVIAGLDWLAANHPTGLAGVVNMSLGGAASSSLDIAVENLINRKISVVVAAGNSNADACRYSPARVPAALTIGSTETNDARAGYSNFGTCLDLFAPGSSIPSAWIGSTTATSTISGTSMASPHVAGIVARLLASSPNLSPSQVDAIVKNGATANVVSNAGSGSLNLLSYSLLSSDEPVRNPDEEPVSEPAPTKPKKGKGNGKGKRRV